MNIICAATIFINLTNIPWNSKDNAVYQRARVVCSTDSRYKDITPCVKSLIKHPEQHYSVICGKENK